MLNTINSEHFFTVPNIRTDIAASTQPVMFHGVNKSGSLACASVLQKAYIKHDRSDQFMCRYFGIPDSTEAAIDAVRMSVGQNHMLLIDHNLVGYSPEFPEFPKVPYMTLLRSPVRRMFSCYYWIQTYHPEQCGNRDFRTWVKESSLAYSLVFQFACFESPDRETKLKIRGLAPIEVKKLANDWFDKNVACYGVSEYFEESLMLFADYLNLPSIPAWVPDKRNVNRPAWENISSEVFSDVEELLEYDVCFYNQQLERLKEQFNILRGSPDFIAYKDACANVRLVQEQARP